MGEATIRSAGGGCLHALPVVPGCYPGRAREGSPKAGLLIVGEQPGDKEDLAGRPFVGPAGRILDAALAEAGIDRTQTFVTNAVKHFKHELRGKRRLHKGPNAYEIDRCHWRLENELRLLKPAGVVALGTTAVRSLIGRPVSLSQARGKALTLQSGLPLIVTIHPSYLLRIRDAQEKRRHYAGFLADLTEAAGLLNHKRLGRNARGPNGAGMAV